jgi:hypothetical protein
MHSISSQPDPAWEPILSSPRAISQYIADNSSEAVCREQIEEYMFDAGARLRLIPLSELREGNPDGNAPSAKKAARYAKLPLESMPPLVVMDGVVEDGNHRFRDALRRGAQAVWCYEVLGLDELGIEPDAPIVLTPPLVGFPGFGTPTL